MQFNFIPGGLQAARKLCSKPQIFWPQVQSPVGSRLLLADLLQLSSCPPCVCSNSDNSQSEQWKPQFPSIGYRLPLASATHVRHMSFLSDKQQDPSTIDWSAAVLHHVWSNSDNSHSEHGNGSNSSVHRLLPIASYCYQGLAGKQQDKILLRMTDLLQLSTVIEAVLPVVGSWKQHLFSHRLSPTATYCQPCQTVRHMRFLADKQQDPSHFRRRPIGPKTNPSKQTCQGPGRGRGPRCHKEHTTMSPRKPHAWP